MVLPCGAKQAPFFVSRFNDAAVCVLAVVNYFNDSTEQEAGLFGDSACVGRGGEGGGEVQQGRCCGGAALFWMR